MKLYHGSTIGVETPNLQQCRPATDFGRAFYTTTNFEQAEKWAKIKQKRANSENCVVSVFDFDDSVLYSSDYKVRFFENATHEWLDFVVDNRRGIAQEQYDFVTGPVANDSLYATILLYEQGLLTADAAIERLKVQKPYNQLSFNTKEALKNLKFVEIIKSPLLPQTPVMKIVKK
ncbi:MAG: DUF3990 domain-containing protein [Prevotellaceae bacterium]|jgi:hypothetical protein|nr:DUF3990 domain-containing protein [Prevotellaceae bacterium]